MRTKKWCLSKGLVYTGYSSRLSHDLKPKLDELRASGYTAYLSQWDKDPLSRSPGTGYSIYADKRWSQDQEEKSINLRLSQIPNRRESAHNELTQKLEALLIEEDELNCRLDEIRVSQLGGPW